ncbi:translation elongation factor [Aphanothece hegewaldii CCALA 016]|uniref:Translation elongation factor n=1 Tax=Aphanothece hegewaldii CCALA 016 TaxID=2107694 RepID=A0A2T1LZ42_9CHRO|nr:translation elongation factor [Aphanothece hegewaldii]PSF37606.1 translation elongation factor [Aphanothece hegewaldii CCALA 016]
MINSQEGDENQDINSQETEKSKNDIAWERLFDEYNILDEINKNGKFEITSSQINQIRESRLMAKFDHSANLPKIFKAHNLSILPISRNKYIIGYFDAYFKVSYQDIQTIPVSFPQSIESIDYTNLYSESIALNCAFNAGIINALFNEICFYTLSGRMSTGSFSFNIKNKISERFYELSVSSSQCEIDAGFENDDFLLIIESKIYQVDDFLIRQLYYPYRLWKSKMKKEVVPILMTYSSSKNLFSFFIYRFEDDFNFNSIKLVEQKNFRIYPEEISSQDVSEIFINTQIKKDPPNIAFPQANDFNKIVDLLSLLVDASLTKDEISENYEFDIRQAGYYSDSARYLGLVEKINNRREVTIKLTEEGEAILCYGYRQKILCLISKILEHEVFYKVFEITLDEGCLPDKDRICSLMSHLNLKPKVIVRRAGTVSAWIKWILSQTD